MLWVGGGGGWRASRRREVGEDGRGRVPKTDYMGQPPEQVHHSNARRRSIHPLQYYLYLYLYLYPTPTPRARQAGCCRRRGRGQGRVGAVSGGQAPGWSEAAYDQLHSSMPRLLTIYMLPSLIVVVHALVRSTVQCPLLPASPPFPSQNHPYPHSHDPTNQTCAVIADCLT